MTCSSSGCMRPGSLSHGTSICLCIHLPPALRIGRGLSGNFLPPTSGLLRLPEMESDGQGDAGTWEQWPSGRGFGFGFASLYPPPPQGPRQGSWGQTAWGCAALPRPGWDIKAGNAGACQPGFVSPAPISA